jgi:hypothetical protein
MIYTMALSLSNSPGKIYTIVNQAAAIASTLDLTNEKSQLVIVSFIPNSIAGGLQNIIIPTPINNYGQKIIVICNVNQTGVNVNSSTVISSTSLASPVSNILYQFGFSPSLNNSFAYTGTLRFDRSVYAYSGDQILLQSTGVYWLATLIAKMPYAITV